MDNFKQLEMRQLRKHVKQLKNKQSSVDGINMKILKSSFQSIGDRYLQLINNSLNTGTFPQNWKKSTVIPIEKKCNTILCEEFRPINMVPSYEKLLEVVVNEQVIEYVEQNNILSEFQAGFRKNNSCESALQTILFNWKNALDNKLIIGAVFLDFRRAFETIDRQLLILKMKKYGFGPTVIKWIEEYLSNRTQVTKYNNCISSEKKNYSWCTSRDCLGTQLVHIIYK